MADISKDEIKLMSSEVLADTEDGGGQMTSNEIVDGNVNNLFPDISRLDRTYGRVSLRKAYLSIQTEDRATYYGAHVALTEQATDPLVGTALFTTEDWFDTRDNCKDRIESYLTKGPQYLCALLGNHYQGTKSIMMFGHTGLAAPEIGDVLVISDDSNEQYVRVMDAALESQAFVDSNGGIYYKDVVSIEIGTGLNADFTGTTPEKSISFTTLSTSIYTTVVADASKYYGVSSLAEDAGSGDLSLRIDSMYASIVPSSKSQTAVTDFGAGMTLPAMLDIDAEERTLSASLNLNAETVIGYDIMPGSLSFSGGGVSITDNGDGSVKDTVSGATVGSLIYGNGTLTLDGTLGSGAVSGTYTFTPSLEYDLPTCTGSIAIDTNNRGFVYVFNCIPSPKAGTLRVDYLTEGKWYTMSDNGNGALSGSDSTIGTGIVNFTTGSVALTLGAQPDAGSMILLYWGTEIQVTALPDYEGNTAIPCKVPFALTKTPGVGTLAIEWAIDTDVYEVRAKTNGNLDYYLNDTLIEEDVGRINYADLTGWFAPPVTLNEGDDLIVSYTDNEVSKIEETLSHDGNAVFTGTLDNIDPITPGSVMVGITFTVDSASEVEGYRFDSSYGNFSQPMYDDGAGNLIGGPGGTIDYITGVISINSTQNSSVQYFGVETVTYDLGPNSSSASYEQVTDEIVTQSSGFSVNSGAAVSVEYSTTDTAVDYTETLQAAPVYEIDRPNNTFLIPGTVWLTVKDFGDVYDDSQGNIIRVSDSVTVGGINYNTGEVSLLAENADTAENRPGTLTAGAAAFDLEERTTWRFRCPGSPITPGSFTVQVTSKEGTLLDATADFDGNIVGTKIDGYIDYQTGVVSISFGEWLVTSEHTGEDWLVNAPEDGDGNSFKFEYILPSTMTMNCVVESYLPLDADLLGLDSVRLPMDGKVPIFRDGYIILIHHTETEIISTPTAGATATLSRDNVNLIELYDNDGVYVPEVGNYSVDLTAGTIEFEDPLDLSVYSGPFQAMTRIEDMVITSDVQITGHMAISQPLQHDYPANETLVSGVLPIGDVQARIYNEFTDSSWNNIWSNSRQYNPTTAQFDLVNYANYYHKHELCEGKICLCFYQHKYRRCCWRAFRGYLIRSANSDRHSSCESCHGRSLFYYQA